MPPKKDKKKIKAKKAKKMRLSVMEPSPRFATGYNREIPGGVIGSGGGGGYVPSSFSVGGYASRQPPPATPIITPDQFQIQRSLASQAQAIDTIVEEQKAVRRGRRPDLEKAEELGISVDDYRAMRASQRMPSEMPLKEVPIKEQFLQNSGAVSMAQAEDLTGGGGSTPSSNIKTIKVKKSKQKASDMLPPPSSAPPMIGVELFPGGGPERQQGLMLGVPGRLQGQQFSSGTIAEEPGIGDSEFMVTPASGLQAQGKESGV